jgi:hypothetical protein
MPNHTIQNIRAERPGILSADLYNGNELLVSNTLDYCVGFLKQHIRDFEASATCVHGLDVSKIPCPANGAPGVWCGYCKADRLRGLT